MATLEQDRAAFAFAKVQEIKQGTDGAKYKTQLLKLPARLHANGLGQTVAFYLSAGNGKPETEICAWLEDWLLRGSGKVYGAPLFNGKSLIQCITGHGALDAEGQKVEMLYRQASAEARALSIWLKRFAEAFIGDEEGGE